MGNEKTEQVTKSIPNPIINKIFANNFKISIRKKKFLFWQN